MLKTIIPLLLTTFIFQHSTAYSVLEDTRIIAEYKRHLREKNHVKIARTLVHQANWASVGTISTNPTILGYPMVNIISIDDNTIEGRSSGRIHFLLTDLDFTGPDWKHENKVTFLFTDEQNKKCKQRNEDPMEPTCARAMISGKIKQMDKNSKEYPDALAAFTKRHPAATKWINAHSFYLCELQIENIFVLDFYGGPHDVSASDYYNADPDNEISWQ